MRLSLSKKTYYALGMLAAGCHMAQAIAGIAGAGFALLDNIAFILTGLMLLFLASVKGTTGPDKGALFGCFFLLIGAMAFQAPLLQYILLALVWPCFAGYEKSRDKRLTPQFRAICILEALWLAALILVNLGGVAAMGLPANLLGFACAIVRGWLTLSLYRRERDER